MMFKKSDFIANNEKELLDFFKKDYEENCKVKYRYPFKEWVEDDESFTFIEDGYEYTFVDFYYNETTDTITFEVDRKFKHEIKEKGRYENNT